jgi:hypothetical protein
MMDKKEATNMLVQQLRLSQANYIGFIDGLIDIITSLVDENGAYEDLLNDYCDNAEIGELSLPLAYSNFCDILERENKIGGGN